MDQADPPQPDWLRDDEHFVQNMRRHREKLGWTQGELARRLREEAGMENMHQTTVSRMEKGGRPPRLGEARGIAQVLGVGVVELIQPPEAAQVVDAIWSDTSELEQAYRQVTTSAELLYVARIGLERTLSLRQGYVAPDDWSRRVITWQLRRARLALDLLTEKNAVSDRLAPDDEMVLERFREQARPTEEEYWQGGSKPNGVDSEA